MSGFFDSQKLRRRPSRSDQPRDFRVGFGNPRPRNHCTTLLGLLRDCATAPQHRASCVRSRRRYTPSTSGAIARFLPNHGDSGPDLRSNSREDLSPLHVRHWFGRSTGAGRRGVANMKVPFSIPENHDLTCRWYAPLGTHSGMTIATARRAIAVGHSSPQFRLCSGTAEARWQATLHQTSVTARTLSPVRPVAGPVRSERGQIDRAWQPS